MYFRKFLVCKKIGSANRKKYMVRKSPIAIFRYVRKYKEKFISANFRICDFLNLVRTAKSVIICKKQGSNEKVYNCIR